MLVEQILTPVWLECNGASTSLALACKRRNTERELLTPSVGHTSEKWHSHREREYEIRDAPEQDLFAEEHIKYLKIGAVLCKTIEIKKYGTNERQNRAY